jgi:hypothetical protein
MGARSWMGRDLLSRFFSIGYPMTVGRFTGGEVRKLAETTIERPGAFHNPCPLYPARLTRAEGLQVIRVLRGSDGRSTRRPRRGSGL